MQESFSSRISSLSSFISKGWGLKTSSISEFVVPGSLGPSPSSAALDSTLDAAPDSFSDVSAAGLELDNRGFFVYKCTIY